MEDKKYNILITKSSDWEYQEIRKNISAEDILNIMNEFEHKIVIEKSCIKKELDYNIIIYDDYLE